jgi:hypothetical protein
MKRVTQWSLATGLMIAAASSQALAANEVQLVAAYSSVNSYRGISSQSSSYHIYVQNLSSTKQVAVRYQKLNGEWAEMPAAYVRTLGDGRELWSTSIGFCINNCYGDPAQSTDVNFAVKYTVNGQTFWDNNGGSNYFLNKDGGYLITNGHNTFVPTTGAVTRYSFNNQLSYSGNIIIRNIAPGKAVKMFYSVNNWATQQSIDAVFVDPMTQPPYSRIPNPGQGGGEIWSFYLQSLPEGQVLQYYFKYDVNGQTFYENNFGQNFKAPIPEYASLYARGSFNNWEASSGSLWPNVDGSGNLVYQLTYADVTGHDPLERFKFDVKGDWSISYGDNDNNGYSRNGIADLSGQDIKFMDGPGYYSIKYTDRTRQFSVQKQPQTGTYMRTVIFMYGQTQVGQDMFLRGGVDWNYAKEKLGRDCWADKWLCAIPITHRIMRMDTSRTFDQYLDWYGAEQNQGTVEGSPLVWTTNNAANSNKVAQKGYGYTPMNKWGDHYWMLDVMVDCSRGAKVTINGKDEYWFELKSYISNGPGWEPNLSQPGAPYASGNHFAKCGAVNKFRRGEAAAEITDL